MSAEGLVLTPAGVARVQEALANEELDGWLLYDFHQRNPISVSLLGLRWTTRRSFVLIPRSGDPVALIHAIERSSWRQWPWEIRTYAGWRELDQELGRLFAGRGRLATETSESSAVPTLDLLPAGTLQAIRAAGADVVSSGNLVTLFYSTWSEEQLREHRLDAAVIESVAMDAFARAAEHVRSGSVLTEGGLAGWIREEMVARGVGVDIDTHVAIGPTAADPHYDPGERGEIIGLGDVLMIDLWGKRSAEGVPADQTWMGYLGPKLPPRVAEVWDVVRDARDAGLEFLREGAAAGATIHGYEVDDACRAVIERAGFGEFFIHRTGHSIDRNLHGSGPNLDNLETRDDRRLIDGVGFSVEPGVYLPNELGVRSEVDVHFTRAGVEVTTPHPQREIFLLLNE